LKLKHAFALFVLCLILFAFYLPKEGFRGYDSYYFLNFICKSDSFEQFGQINIEPLALLVFSGLPCDFVLLKLMLFLLFFAGVLIIAFTGELINKDYGWMAGAFTFLSPILYRTAFKLENDAFALPFMFASVFYFVKFLKQNKRIDFFKSIFWGMIGAGFWGVTLYLPFGFALLSVPFIAIALLTSFFFGQRLLVNALPIESVLESNPTGAIINYVGYFFAVVGLNYSILLPSIVFFGGLGLLNPKLSILAIPFLSLLVVEALRFIPKNWRTLLPWFCLALAFAWGFNLYFDNPTQGELEITSFAAQQSLHKNLDIFNDWNLGYIVAWFGGKPSGWGGSQDLNQLRGVYSDMNDSIVITTQDLNCTQMKSISHDFGESGKLFAYRC